MKTRTIIQTIGLSLLLLTMTSSLLLAQSAVVEDFESGDFASMNWQFSGTPNSWFVEQTVGTDNNPTYAATAKAIAFNDEVTLSIVKTFEEPSTVTFDLKQTEANVLIFGYSGGSMMYWPGWDQGWQSMSFDVPAGTHEIIFTSYNMGTFGQPFTMSDSLFIDNITFPNQAYGSPAFVQVVHNAADPQLSSVDVYLDNNLILDNFTFRTATPYVELPGGAEFQLDIKAANSTPSDPALWSGNYTLEQGVTYQLIAEGLLEEQGFDPFFPFDLAVFTDARQSASVPGNTDILIHHGSTDAPVVTIAVAGTVLAENLAYGDFAGYFDINSQNVILNVLEDSTSNSLIGSFYAPLANYLNQAATILASGFASPETNNNGPVFGLFVVPSSGGDLYPLPLLTEDLMNTVEDFETADFSIYNWYFDGTPDAWHIVTDVETGTLAATATHEAFNEYQTMYFYGYFEEDGKMIVDVKQTSESSVVIISSENGGVYYTPEPAGVWQTVEILVQAGFQQLSFTSYLMGEVGEPFITQNDSVLIDNIRFSSAPPVVQFDLQIVDFGMTSVSQTKVATVNMTNLTEALLMFLSFETDSDNYTAYPSTWALEPGESMPIVITFNPSDIGEFPDVLRVDHFGYLGSGQVELPLMGEGVLMPPANLTANTDENAVTLDWLPPGFSPDELRFGNGDPFSAIGTSEGTYEFAARFSPTDLMPYAGKQLNQVGFYIHSTDAAFNLKVYTGLNADTELINLPLSGLQADTWNDITLPFPILLDEVDYLWIGYEIIQAAFDYIAGIDGGPGVTGSGDLLSINGSMWTTLGDYGFSNNWNIRGLVSEVQGNDVSIVTSVMRSLPELLGYNVYRDSLQLNDEPLTGLTYTDQIEAGEVYVYGVTALYDIGESNPATITVTAPGTLSMPEGWDFNPTPLAHNIHIPVDVLQIGMNLQAGDMVGAFYMDNGVAKAAGAGQWDGEHLVVTIYGNDPSTPQKDGFDENETIQWKLYMHNTGSTANLASDYSPMMPHHDGTFRMLGLSMIEILEMDVVGIGETTLSQLQIYPNPSKGNFRIDGLQQGDLLRIYEASGRLILQEEAGQGTNYFQLSTKGFYLIEMQRQNQLVREKLIIN